MAKVGSGKSNAEYLSFNLASVLSVVVLLSCPLLLVSCNEPQGGAAAVGRQDNMPPQARKAELLKFLDRKFEDPDAHFQLAQLYHAEGQWGQAEYHYSVALSFDPAKDEARAAMVKLFLDAGDTANSKICADGYMNQAANSAMLSLRLAMAFQNEQLDGYALDAFQQALNLAPTSAEVNKQMGFYYLTKGDKARAKDHFIASYQSDNSQPDVAHELGRLGVELRIRPRTSAKSEEPERMVQY